MRKHKVTQLELLELQDQLKQASEDLEFFHRVTEKALDRCIEEREHQRILLAVRDPALGPELPNGEGIPVKNYDDDLARTLYLNTAVTQVEGIAGSSGLTESEVLQGDAPAGDGYHAGSAADPRD